MSHIDASSHNPILHNPRTWLGLKSIQYQKENNWFIVSKLLQLMRFIWELGWMWSKAIWYMSYTRRLGSWCDQTFLKIMIDFQMDMNWMSSHFLLSIGFKSHIVHVEVDHFQGCWLGASYAECFGAGWMLNRCWFTAHLTQRFMLNLHRDKEYSFWFLPIYTPMCVSTVYSVLTRVLWKQITGILLEWDSNTQPLSI